MANSPITVIMANLSLVMMTPDAISDATTLEHIRKAHDAAQAEWRKEQDELNLIDWHMSEAAE